MTITSPLELDHFLTSVLLILAERDLPSLENATLVCKRWKALTDFNYFWERVVTRRWPTDVGCMNPRIELSHLFSPWPCPFCPTSNDGTPHACLYDGIFNSIPPCTSSTGIFLLNNPPPVPPPNPRSWTRAISRLNKSILLLRRAESPLSFAGYGSETDVSDVVPFLLLTNSNEQVQDFIEKYLPFRSEQEQDSEDERIDDAKGRLVTGEQAWIRFWGKQIWDEWKNDMGDGMRKWFPRPVSFLCRSTASFRGVNCCVFVDGSLDGHLYGFVQAIVLSDD